MFSLLLAAAASPATVFLRISNYHEAVRAFGRPDEMAFQISIPPR